MKSRTILFLLLLPWPAVAQQVLRPPVQPMATPSPNLIPNIDVNRTTDVRRGRGSESGALVSASDLAVPGRARKEYEKGHEALAKQDLTRALERLKKAVAIYPAFAAAYNDIGVIYLQQGDYQHGREALEAAIRSNDRLSLAYVNEGRLDIAESKFEDAETALSKASAVDPTDPISLLLLTYVELKEGKIAEGLATSRTVHALAKPHAFAHELAARAFESQKKIALAIAELRTFLKEEPTGPRAEAARQELRTLQTRTN